MPWFPQNREPEHGFAQLKDGRTHLAYKAEHVVDLESDLLLAAEILPATAADTETLVDSVLQAQVQLAAAGSKQQIDEVAADKGYHAAPTLELAMDLQLRTYIPEPRPTSKAQATNASLGCITGRGNRSPEGLLEQCIEPCRRATRQLPREQQRLPATEARLLL